MNFKKTLLAVALTLSAGFAMAADLPQVAILATGGMREIRYYSKT